jgi:hypothetical protein
MISTLARPGEAAERIGRAHRRVQRDVGRHLAFELEIHVVALVQQAHGAAQILQEHALRIAEVRIGQEGDARLVAHAARELRVRNAMSASCSASAARSPSCRP